ncbi:HprK-related kinase A [Thauera sp. CAU 1555]|uniref:HprK-related kinase A n=1 Tax=Thauera sedimentorum TaxID=2767595 RepID=A0ABR9B7R0_9RHOO|nr:HprK-related kinase A [Thauera sedimentorum]MBD8501472.1 HprK-related kinase A [Thauera sedimentorum]
MPLGTLPRETLARWLAQGRLGLRTGPFTFRIASKEAVVADNLRLLYAHHLVIDSPPFADFHVSLERPASPRRWLRPQVDFRLDGYSPFLSLPAPQAFALFEWGMNWCIASHAHQYLLLHAAVLARGDDAALLPAPPGAGKSTLCAYLAHRGWRLLSDELALIDPANGLVHGLARPVNLKNAAIDVIRDTLPEAVLNTPVPDTKKGTVAHLAPPASAVAAVDRPARLQWIVTPRYLSGSALHTERIPRPEAMAMLIDNAFNYDVLGATAFTALADLISRAPAIDLCYERLEEAREWFGALKA